MSWGGKLFFAVALGFLIFTIAGGYGATWKQLLTGPIA